MGIWSSFRDALGLNTDPVPGGDAPLALSPQAEARLVALAPERGARIELSAVPAGWMVMVHEIDASGQPHPGFHGHHVVCEDGVFARLNGLTIDFGDDRWRVGAKVSVRAKDTPNPNSRQYITDRQLSSGRVYVVSGTAAAPYLAHRLVQRPDVASVLVRGNTLSIERVPSSPWDPIDRAVSTAIREHVLSAGGILKPPAPANDGDELREAVWEILEHRVLPALHRDGGDLELVDVADGVVSVHLVGACRTCPASTLTLKNGIERTLLDAFPGEIDEVVSV